MSDKYHIDTLPLPGTYVCSFNHNVDDRGYFEELYNADEWPLFRQGVHQVSRSMSKRDVWRGLHLQIGMAKAMRIVSGRAVLVMVDLHPLSQTYLHHYMSYITNDWVIAEPWIARGFMSLSDNTVIEYLHSIPVNPMWAFAVNAWDLELHGLGEKLDNLVPREDVILTDKDMNAMPIADWEQTTWFKGILEDESNNAPQYTRTRH